MRETAQPDLLSLTDRLLDAARKAGAGAADAIAVCDSSVSVDVRGGRLEEAQRRAEVEFTKFDFANRHHTEASPLTYPVA